MSDLQHVAADLGYDLRAAAWLRANVAPFGPQEPPDDPRIYNRRREDGTYPPLSSFFDAAVRAPEPSDRLPLGAPVVFPNGVHGVVVDYSTLSSQRYEIAWFDRHFWRVNRKCFDRSQFEVYTGSAADADRSPASAA